MPVLNMLITKTVIILLSYYGTSADIALYNAPIKVANFLNLPLQALAFIYFPTATKLFIENLHSDIVNLYRSTTKCAMIFVLPLLLYLMLDAEFVVTKLFGLAYIESANILRLLAVGTSCSVFLGPNGMTLISIGSTKEILFSNLIGAGIVILLSFLLIPKWYSIGGAVATCFGLTSATLFRSISLYVKSGIHCCCKNYILSLLCSTILVVAEYYYLFILLAINKTILHLMFGFLAFGTTFLSFLICNGFERGEAEVIKRIGKTFLYKIHLGNRLST
jgi:O-antigen/teichoic acid export membrane protein